MNTVLRHDLQNFENLLEQAKQQSLNYLNTINERNTSTTNSIILEHTLHQEGIGTMQTLEKFNARFEPIIVASSGPRYLGFVTGGSTPASIVGDWLTSIYDQNPQAIKGSGDVSAQIELETIQLMLSLFQLPHTFLGGFVSGATMSNFTCLAVARQWIGHALGFDFAKTGVTKKVNILTATPHSSSIKALSMLGIGSSNFTTIKVADGNRECIDVHALELAIQPLNQQPFILITSAGTVNTVDFDDFQAIHALRNKYQFWWHIDAAFGAFAKCSTTHQHVVEGWENADSITIDCHKWLNVPYESAVFFIQEKHTIHQMETFQNSNAPYLGNALENFSYLNFLPENSRRLIALPVWFSLQAYGRFGIRDIVENSIARAQQLGKIIEAIPALELVAPVRLNTVCFTLHGKENQSHMNEFLMRINATQKVFMTPTTYRHRTCIRAAFVNWRTTFDDVQMIGEWISTAATERS